MTQYSVQPIGWLFVKAMDFCLSLKIWAKILVKI